MLLKARGVKKHFPVRKGFLKRTVGQLQAVDGVDLDIFRGETVGLVGESGCGKSTLGRTLLRLLEPTAGEIEFDGVDVRRLGSSDLKGIRRHMQIVFQDSVGSLDPRMNVNDLVGEGLRIHGLERKRRDEAVTDVLERVGLSAEAAGRYPHQFSGGQRQRIGLARALVLRPKFIVADEPVSALDVSIQSQVLNLLVELKNEFNLTYLFVAHDLAVVGYISDRVAVMYLGKIVELATSEELFRRPLHPYTMALLSANPEPIPGRKRQRVVLQRRRSEPDQSALRLPLPDPLPDRAGHLRGGGAAARGSRRQPRRRVPLRRDAHSGDARADRLSLLDVRLLHDQRVPMRDGISLSADVYLPLSGGPHPTIYQWTPYESTRERFVGWGAWFAQRGYAAVVSDVRGRYESEGEFEAWSRDGVDAHDSLTWAAGEEWCNGRIGTWGRSYGALVQWQLMHAGPPEPRVHRAAGDPRRLLLGRLLDGRRFPARADARRGRDLDERDQPGHQPERRRADAERPRLAPPAADRARRGGDRPQGRLLARVVGAPGERRVLAPVPPSPRDGDRADLPAGWLVRPVLRLPPALVREDRLRGFRTGC